jgi:hypothetical protein
LLWDFGRNVNINNIELTLEVNNLKQMLGMLQEGIQAKCVDCGSLIAEKYFNMEQFCKRCPLFRFKGEINEKYE